MHRERKGAGVFFFLFQIRRRLQNTSAYSWGRCSIGGDISDGGSRGLGQHPSVFCNMLGLKPKTTKPSSA